MNWHFQRVFSLLMCPHWIRISQFRDKRKGVNGCIFLQDVGAGDAVFGEL